MPRYVVLHHTLPAQSQRPSHYDLMLETAGGLRSWAIRLPLDAHRSQAADELPLHRAKYLHYEGPISGNRGAVTQWDAGEFTWIACHDDRLEIELAGRRLTGTVSLSRSDTNGWNFCYAPKAGPSSA